MMDNITRRIQAIFPCLPIAKRGIHLPEEEAQYKHISEKAAFKAYTLDKKTPMPTSDEVALAIVSVMLEADKAGSSLDANIQSLVRQAGGWSEYLAKKILSAMEDVLKAGKMMNSAMKEACDKACEAAKVFEGFAADHPYATAFFCTVIAVGVLAVLAPYALEILGFGVEGPIEGKCGISY